MTLILIGFDICIPFAAGSIGFCCYPKRIARDVKAGERTEAEAKQKLKGIKVACCIATGAGLYKIREYPK
jgi:hypothetical protein